MCLRSSNMTCSVSFMTFRREAEATPAPHTTAGRREAAEQLRSQMGDVAVRELLVAGGRRGFTPKELFA